MNPFDDMALARATAARHGYHQRSPSLMVVIPLEDHDGLYCDDLNASFYEFFQEDDHDVNQLPQQSKAETESPRSVLDSDHPTLSMPAKIPVLTDVIQSSSFSKSSGSRHRRSRNRGLGNKEFARQVLPHLDCELNEYQAENDDVAGPPHVPSPPVLALQNMRIKAEY